MLRGGVGDHVLMGRRGAGSSLHQQVITALIRGAQAQDESRELIATTHALHDRLEATRAAVQRSRERRTTGRAFAFGHVDDQDRFRSG
jgi:hypothetical protein